MDLIPGITKEDYGDYVLYYIENISEELKNEIRERLVAICHGEKYRGTTRISYSYRKTAEEFIRRYEAGHDNRKKGFIGELLIHTLIEIEGKFITASPFFNMEEKSFKKGYDIILFDNENDEIWITEIKSGNIQTGQKDASAAVVNLINTAKNDLLERLNNDNIQLWYNAINSASVAMRDNTSQKAAVIELLEDYSDNTVTHDNKSEDCNVILAATLFHPMHDRMKKTAIEGKYKRELSKHRFKKLMITAIQKNTFEAVYDFLKSESEMDEE